MIKEQIYKKSWIMLILLLLTDILMVSLHLIYGQINPLFDLDHEANIPTYYQSIKMFILGLLLIFFSKKNKKLNFLIPLGLIFTYIGIDEAFQLHERTEYLIHAIIPETITTLETTAEQAGFRSSRWLLYFIPIILITFAYFTWVWQIVRKRLPNFLIPFTLTFILLFVVIYLEFINSQGTHRHEVYQRLMIAEEFAEMISASILLPYVIKIHKQT